MPEAGEKPDCQEVEHGPHLSPAVAAKRDIHIFPKPRAERDVPPAPEVCDAAGHIGMAEVCGHMKTKHLPQSDRHQGIAAEVKIKLHGVGKGAKPCKRGGDTLVTDHADLVPQRPDAVCDNDLVAKSYDKGFEAVVETIRRDRPFFQRVADVGINDNRSRDQLRKHAQVCAEADKGPVGPRFSQVHINDVGGDLEGVETDPERQSEL